MSAFRGPGARTDRRRGCPDGRRDITIGRDGTRRKPAGLRPAFPPRAQRKQATPGGRATATECERHTPASARAATKIRHEQTHAQDSGPQPRRRPAGQPRPAAHASQALRADPEHPRRDAHSPLVLAAYTTLNAAITEQGRFDAANREAIALAVGAVNGCDYCQAAHTVGGQAAALSRDQTIAIRTARASSAAKLEALLSVARQIAAQAGAISDEVWDAALAVGWDCESPR